MKLALLIIFGITAILSEKSRILKDFTVGYNRFAANIYKSFVKSTSGSFVISPLSVDIILALFHEGAKGKTAQEILEVLHLPADYEEVAKIFQLLNKHFTSTEDYQYTSANKVYLAQNFSITDEFRTAAVETFGAEVEALDFSKSTESAAAINRWVENKTENKIKDLVKPNDLMESVSVLVNAIYFHGKWVKPFASASTAKRTFHVNKSKKIRVAMMQRRAKFYIHESSKLNSKILLMPYKGGHLSMTIVLPNDIDGLSRLEGNINDVLWFPAFQCKRAVVIIPKFKLETTVLFNPILQDMGIQLAFSNAADFSAFGGNKTLKIGKIIQKAFVEVQETGTTAAGGSAGTIQQKSGNPLLPPRVRFIANHPFIYYIKLNGVIVFVGKYVGTQ